MGNTLVINSVWIVDEQVNSQCYNPATNLHIAMIFEPLSTSPDREY